MTTTGGTLRIFETTKNVTIASETKIRICMRCKILGETDAYKPSVIVTFLASNNAEILTGRMISDWYRESDMILCSEYNLPSNVAKVRIGVQSTGGNGYIQICQCKIETY
jgi:hypothetical protein